MTRKNIKYMHTLLQSVKHKYVLIFILLFNMRILTWFDCPKVCLSGDLRLIFDPQVAESRYLYFIDEVDFGLPSPYPFRLLNPLEAITFILVEIGLEDPCLIEFIAVYLISIAAMYFSFKMFYKLTGSLFASLIGSIYLFSTPFMIIDREISAVVYTYVMLIISLSSILLLKVIDGDKIGIILYPLSILLATSRYPNLRILYLIVYWQIILLLYLFISKRVSFTYKNSNLFIRLRLDNLSKVFKNIIQVIVLTVIILMPIIIYTIYNLDIFTSQFAKLNLAGIQPKDRILDIFRMLYMWSFTAYEKKLGAYFVPYYIIYYTWYMIIITLLFSLIIPILGVLKGSIPLRSRIYLFLVLTILYSLVFGPKIYGDLYVFFVKSKIIAPFRNTYNWYYLISLLSALLVSLFELYFNRKPVVLKATFIVTLVSLAIISSFPLYTGAVTTNWIDPSQGKCYNIPYNLYSRINDVLPSDKWSLTMPPVGVYIVFKEGDYIWSLGNPYITMYSKPIITGAGSEYLESPYKEDLLKFMKMISRNDGRWVAIARLWGVEDYIVSKGLDDFKPQLLFKKFGYFESINALLMYKLKIKYKTDIIDVYSIENTLPMLYSADIVKAYNGSIESMAESAKSYIDYARPAILDLKNYPIASNITCSQPIDWVKESPVKYSGMIKCSGRALIVLSTSYSDYWKLDIENGRVLHHVRVNHFMNGWVVEVNGESRFSITYTLHYKMVYVILISSLLYILLSIVVLKYKKAP